MTSARHPKRASAVRHAAHVEPATKSKALARLKRIEGQVRGVHRMVEEERYCADVITQIASIQQALRAVGRELMRNHLRHCAHQAISSGPAEASRMHDELLDLMYGRLR
ncbi:MAG: metal-sensitive transcriptional regulator [Gemmatimonadaceae bacterium]|nr:metal-sensitive transcriptional regulator [Gemmatimonadaceae bacterium]